MEEMLNLIANVGFPIAVALFLLVRVESKMTSLTAAINDLREAFDFGYEEYFYSGDLCLVEWPEKIEQLLPDNVMTVRITVDSDTARTFAAAATRTALTSSCDMSPRSLEACTRGNQMSIT